MLYWFFKLILFGPVVKVVHHPWVEGLENVPEDGAAILASNHLSFSDSIFLPLALPRRITFPAKIEYFTEPGLKGRLTKVFFSGTGQIPIDRSGGGASNSALLAGVDVLKRGELFGIYPEGTRSPDGRLYKGKTGVARLALEAGVPVIPVAMIDTDKFQPTGQRIPNLSQVGIRVGKPRDYSRYQGMADDPRILRAITDEIMYDLAQLSGREYVDEYAGSRKDAFAAKGQELLAQGAAKAQGIVTASRAGVGTAAGRAEEFLAAARERTQARIESARTPAEPERRGYAVGEDPLDGSPLRAQAVPGVSQSDAPGAPHDSEAGYDAQVAAAAAELLTVDDDGDPGTGGGAAG